MKREASPFQANVADAFRKLKSHVYYDTSDLFLRDQLADYETKHANGLEKSLWSLADAIEKYVTKPDFFNNLFGNLSVKILPKKFTPESDNLPKNFVTNRRVEPTYQLEASTYFIDLPVELHIISILWLMKYGYRLDDKLGPECLGNRLVLNKDRSGIVAGLGLFKRYFVQYQKWRDDAVEEAISRLKNNEDVVVVNLDIMDYFHSVRINFEEIEELLEIEPTDNVHILFKKIHSSYTDTLLMRGALPGLEMSFASAPSILPIGLASSYVLANWHLRDFDKRVLKRIPQTYYGRYVDDILIVIPKPSFDYHKLEACDELRFDFNAYVENQAEKGNEVKFDENSLDEVERYILETFNPILELITPPAWIDMKPREDGSPPKIFKVNSTPDCYIQCGKTLLYHFDSNESLAVIDKFRHDLQERSSEFRDFPDGDEMEPSFDEKAYHLIYDDSEGKPRTLKDYKENRYGLSIFLSHRIFSALRRIREVDFEESTKLLKLFKGLNTLKHFRLWEKVFTYFIINDDEKSYLQFYEHTKTQINKIEFSDARKYGTSKKEIRTNLIKYLDSALQLSLALNPHFVRKDSRSWKKVRPALGNTSKFRLSNLIRHHFVVHPLLNYTSGGSHGDVNLIQRSFPNAGVEVSVAWDSHAKKYSPRRVKLWECCIAIANKRITNNEQLDDTKENFYLEEAFDLMESINQPPKERDREYRRNRYFSPTYLNLIAPGDEVVANEIFVDSDRISTSPKLAFANLKLNDAYFTESLRGTPNLSRERYENFAEIVNASRRFGVDVLLLPECSVPHDLVSIFAKHSERNQMLTVAGLEHWRVGDESFNFIITILPMVVDGINDALVVYRLKNHYALDERRVVEGNSLSVPVRNPFTYRYDLFNWRGLYVVPYYCAELTDIQHRGIFRSKCDLIISSEWNKDTNYFSNIVESMARDIHAYVAQVNNSVYGDSRLTQPSRTEIKDLLKLKGGINTTILVGELDLAQLREFQRKEYELTRDDKAFKPVPPDFDRASVLKRIGNKRIFDI